MAKDYNDPFSAGVQPGGLRDIMEIKILVCYVINALKIPFTREEINTIFQREGLANYFLTNSAIDDLIEKDNLHINEKDEITLTESGIHIAELLDVDLPKSIRRKAINTALALKTYRRREHENKIVIEKRENDWNISITLFDTDSEMMKLDLAVADILQAEEIKKNFLNNPQKVYEGIIQLLTEKEA